MKARSGVRCVQLARVWTRVMSRRVQLSLRRGERDGHQRQNRANDWQAVGLSANSRCNENGYAYRN